MWWREWVWEWKGCIFPAEGVTFRMWKWLALACFPIASVSLLVFCKSCCTNKQWLIRYLRKLNNRWAHGSLQRENKFCDCAARLFANCSSSKTKVGSWACDSWKYNVQSSAQLSSFVFSICWSGLWSQRPLRPSCLVVVVSMFCLCVISFRFILVFSCLVLSVFSTIPAHQDFSSHCLLILVRNCLTIFTPQPHY